MTVDVTKGIGFAAVVFGHLVASGSDISRVIFSFHMPLFFIMSGYLMPCSVTRKSFIKKGFSLLFNYICFAIIGLIVTLVIPMWRSGFSSSSFFYDVVYNTQPECIHVGQIWYLFAMLWSIIFFYGIHFVFRNNRVLCVAAVVLITAGSVISSKLNIGLYIQGGVYPITFKMLSGMSGLLFLEFGFIMKQFRIINKIDSMRIEIKSILACLFIVATIFVAMKNIKVNIALGVYGNVAMYYFTSIAGTLGIVFLSSILKGRLADAIGFYGRNSLSLFSIHSFFLYGYAAALSIIKGYTITIMNNITTPLCLLGLIVVLTLMIPIPRLYEASLGRLINYHWKKLDSCL